MIIPVKRMVCPRCIATVARVAQEAGLAPTSVVLGEVALAAAPSPEQLERFRAGLEANGFAIVESEKARAISKIKTLIIQRIHHGEGRADLKLSAYLSQAVNYEYSHLSKLFSSVEAMTIERFATLQRVERAKELLSYHEQSVAEIADLLGYSSPAHLSAQFKRETGMTPSAFRTLKTHARRPLDSI